MQGICPLRKGDHKSISHPAVQSTNKSVSASHGKVTCVVGSEKNDGENTLYIGCNYKIHIINCKKVTYLGDPWWPAHGAAPSKEFPSTAGFCRWRTWATQHAGVNPSHTPGKASGTASFHGTPTRALWASAKNPDVPLAEVTRSLNKNKGHPNQ